MYGSIYIPLPDLTLLLTLTAGLCRSASKSSHLPRLIGSISRKCDITESVDTLPASFHTLQAACKDVEVTIPNIDHFLVWKQAIAVVEHKEHIGSEIATISSVHDAAYAHSGRESQSAIPTWRSKAQALFSSITRFKPGGDDVVATRLRGRSPQESGSSSGSSDNNKSSSTSSSSNNGGTIMNMEGTGAKGQAGSLLGLSVCLLAGVLWF